MIALLLAAAQPPWTPFQDHLISNHYALDVCAETDDVDGCMAAEHRRIICTMALRSDRYHGGGIAEACVRILGREAALEAMCERDSECLERIEQAPPYWLPPEGSCGGIGFPVPGVCPERRRAPPDYAPATSAEAHGRSHPQPQRSSP